MEEWHTKKTENYQLLCETIRARGWKVNFFAVEVGARGYCSPNVVYCLTQLGFTSKLAHTTAKDVSMISMQASFCIWLSSNANDWSSPPFVGSNQNPVDVPLIQPLQICKCTESGLTKPSQVSVSSDPTSPVNIPAEHSTHEMENLSSHPVFPRSSVLASPIVGSRSGSKSKSSFYSPRCVRRTYKDRPLGFVNAGNTCYANAILQALRAVPEFWTLYEEDSSSPSNLAQSLLQIMFKCRSRKAKVEVPLNFLNALSNSISITQGFPFDYNRQQDAHEVLQYVLQELVGISSVAKEAIETKIQFTSVCNHCFTSSTSEDSFSILSVPVATSIQEAIGKFVEDDPLVGENKYDCCQCGTLRDGYRQARIIQAPVTLVVHLKRYSSVNGESTKDLTKVNIFPNLLTLKSISDGIIVNHSYRLRASINHQGNLESGHYWAFVTNSRCSFVKCDDSRVSESKRCNLNNNSSYILFFLRAE